MRRAGGEYAWSCIFYSINYFGVKSIIYETQNYNCYTLILISYRVLLKLETNYGCVFSNDNTLSFVLISVYICTISTGTVGWVGGWTQEIFQTRLVWMVGFHRKAMWASVHTVIAFCKHNRPSSFRDTQRYITHCSNNWAVSTSAVGRWLVIGCRFSDTTALWCSSSLK